MSNGTVLVIDDEKDLLELVTYNLQKEGFETLTAADAFKGLNMATAEQPDLVVLDVMMPGMDGLEVCRQIRSDDRTRRIPVIMLTAKGAETDRIVGLEMGADDYLPKPFSPRELVARVKAVLRRTNGDMEPTDVLRRGEIVIDAQRHEVTVGGEGVCLTATEFRLLQFLASRPGRVFTRDEIIDAAIGRDAVVTDRTVDVHITAIRKKLGESGGRIETIRGFGYKLSDRA
jgi:two-component system phosphate regulon response regulator PhoB